MALLTLKRLIELRACREQVVLFETTFGKSVNVTADLCESVASVFDWDWAADHLMSAPALAEYRQVRDAAHADYKRMRARAFGQLYTGE